MLLICILCTAVKDSEMRAFGIGLPLAAELRRGHWNRLAAARTSRRISCCAHSRGLGPSGAPRRRGASPRRFPAPRGPRGWPAYLCTDLFTREALGFIREHRKEPFFLYLPLRLPYSLFLLIYGWQFLNLHIAKENGSSAMFALESDFAF